MAQAHDPASPSSRRGALVLLAAALAGAALGGGALLLAERLRDAAPSRPARAAAPTPGAAAAAAAPVPPAPGGRKGPGAEVAAIRWRCPMHPGLARAHPGECPICGMTLVKDDDVEAGVERPGSAADGTDRR